MSSLPYTSNPLIFWMDPAERFVTKDSSNRVSSVFNRVDGNLIIQPTQSKQPIWSAKAINGLPGLTFSGGQSLQYDYIAQLLTNKQPFTITQIFNNFTGNGCFIFIGHYITGTTIGYTSMLSQGLGFTCDYEDNAAQFYGYSSYIFLNTGVNIASSFFDGTNIRTRVNGVDLIPISNISAPGLTTFTEMRIGCASIDGGEVLAVNCNIGEVIIHKGASSSLVVERYFKEKYSL